MKMLSKIDFRLNFISKKFFINYIFEYLLLVTPIKRKLSNEQIRATVEWIISGLWLAMSLRRKLPWDQTLLRWTRLKIQTLYIMNFLKDWWQHCRQFVLIFEFFTRFLQIINLKPLRSSPVYSSIFAQLLTFSKENHGAVTEW